jgi:hypothetical protein
MSSYEILFGNVFWATLPLTLFPLLNETNERKPKNKLKPTIIETYSQLALTVAIIQVDYIHNKPIVQLH